MNKVFVGGSRQVSRLPPVVTERLNNITNSGAHIIVGDANGADKAVQKFLIDHSYKQVTVFCSGDNCRNNLGDWHTKNINAPKNSKGFQFYAAKDREMAQEADFGLMIWDGKSIGTVLNIFRLLSAGKKAVLINVPTKTTMTFKTWSDWKEFSSRFTSSFLVDLGKRVTSDESKGFSELYERGSLFDFRSPSSADLVGAPGGEHLSKDTDFFKESRFKLFIRSMVAKWNSLWLTATDLLRGEKR